jgi:PleD family two-component response regulator
MQTRTAATRTTLQVTEARKAATERVVVVNGSQEMLELVEAVLNPGRYNLVFIDSNAHAYSEIKRLQPNLVILCTRLENIDGFQVLSMLKLDEETRDIPIVTFTIENDTKSEPDLQDLRFAGLQN